MNPTRFPVLSGCLNGMGIGISKGYADSNPVLSGSQSGMVKGCVSKSILFGIFWMPTYTRNPLTLLQEDVSVIYFLNRSEWVPVLTSSSICNSLLSVFLYIRSQSGLMWHSLHPTNSPCKAWSLFFAGKETSFASFKTISLSSASGKCLRLANFMSFLYWLERIIFRFT